MENPKESCSGTAYYSSGDFMTPTGWRCPTCGRVYAPSVCTCFYCPPKPRNDVGTANWPHPDDKAVRIFCTYHPEPQYRRG